MVEKKQNKYVVYDRTTGRILAVYGVYDAENETYVAQPGEAIQKVIQPIIEGLDPQSVEIIEMEFPTATPISGFRIDLDRRELIPKFQLRLQAERTAIQGDGKDSAEITLTVVDEKGKLVKRFNGELLVTTTHGRLSTIGGKVEARSGSVSIKLTSTVETIDRVSITARDPSGHSTRGTLDLEFL